MTTPNRLGTKRKHDDRENNNDDKSFKFKVMLPNGVAVDLRLNPSRDEIDIDFFIKILQRKYGKVLAELRTKPQRQLHLNDANSLYLLDVNDSIIRKKIVLSNFNPQKCHILRLCDGSRVESEAFENMWDLTPDVELLRELPEEYSFEAAIADLIDNSLQAVWSNDSCERKLISVQVSQNRISIFDTGPGMDDTDKYSITKWGKIGASVHRAYKIKSIGGEPPYLKPFFGMFGYGGPIASMYLGRNAKVFSKTKQSRKVFVLNLKRDALLNSGSELTWRTTGGLRDPMDDEVEKSPHGSFTKVEISELKAKPLETRKLQCMLKDIYFPYIQCDGVSSAGRTMTPVTFQVNGVDLAEVEGGEVSITNLHSCNGDEFVFRLHFVKQDNVATGNPGFKASQKAHARLRCVYFPMVKGKESIEMIQERLETEGCGSKNTRETFSHVSIRRLGRLLPDARWSLLPFMDFRLKRGENSQLFKKCSTRVKCFIETDGGFNPTISKTDLAHHSSFTGALKNFGKKMTESSKDISVEIYRDGEQLTLSQLEKKYQDWILRMHGSFDEEMDSGEDDPILVIGANKKALGISADVLRVHRVFKRKGKCWKHGQKIKILKGACTKTNSNSAYATLEFFLIKGFQGDPGGEAWIICRPLGTSEENGCVLEVNEGNATLLIRDSWCLPVNVIDSEKCKVVEWSEWSMQLEKQQQKNLRIDLLSSQHCEELKVDGELPSLAQIDTGHVFPSKIVAVVRPGNYNSANLSRNLDQKDIFRRGAAMSVQVIFENDRTGDVECLCAAEASASSYDGIHGFYIFELGNKAPDAFQDSGVYKFLFSLANSSCKSFEKTVKVREALRVYKWKIIGDKTSQPHIFWAGSSFPQICIGCFDASHNQKPFALVPKLTVKLRMQNGKHAQINRLKTTLSSDNLVLQIKDLQIECNELDSIRPNYEAVLVICALNESDTLSVPCQVFPGSLQNVKVHLLAKEEYLLPGLVVDEFALEMLDKFGNHIAEGSEVELDVDGFRIMDQIDSKWEVDCNGFITLNGQLQVTGGFGDTVSISLSCGNVAIKREFQIVRRELRVTSEVPETSIAGSRLKNVVFEIVDSSGNTDETIHDDRKRGHYHSLLIKSELWSMEDIIEYSFIKGRCVVPDIAIPQMEGLFCFTAAHSHYPEIQVSVKVSVMMKPNAMSEEIGSPLPDKKSLLIQDVALDIESNLTPEIRNCDQKLLQKLNDLGNQIKSYEDELSALEKKKAGDIEVMCQLKAFLDPDLCKDLDCVISKEVMLEQIMMRSSSASVILSHLCCVDSSEEPEELFMKDVVGVVALLGTVSDNRISRILSGYLGEDRMLAVVCKTYEAVAAMEKYKEDGEVDSDLALHRKAAALGKPISDRFLIICLEGIRPYNGEVEFSGTKRKLCLPDPILPCGNTPAGFLDYAVNFINQTDDSIVSATGHGLQETLFYRLFGETQVYKTRKDMINALSCIKDGAISLDGGIIKENGIISLGCGNPEICFPVSVALEDEMAKHQQMELKHQYSAKKAEVELSNKKIEKLIKKCGKVKKKWEKKSEVYNRFLKLFRQNLGGNPEV